MESESVSSVKFVMDKVSFVNKLPILNKATSDDAKPTPGYLFHEISNISYERSSFCGDLLEYLVTRLEKSSYHVKLKVLRLMHFVVDNGHVEFRQGLRRKASGIREATKFGGPPDPIHGTAPYIMVRKEASELSRILFDIQEDSETNSQPVTEKAVTGALGGMGSGMQGTMQGFGNIPHKEKSLTESLVGGLRDFAGKVLEPPRTTQGAKSSLDKSFFSYKAVQFDTEEPQPSVDPCLSPARDRRTEVPRQSSRRTQRHRPGVAGGGWEDSDDEDASGTPPTSSQSSQGSSSKRLPKEDSLPLSSQIDGSQQLLNRSLTPSKNEPTAEYQLVRQMNDKVDHLLKRKDLEHFKKRCSSMNCDKIAEAVGESLSTKSDKYQLHSLQLMEVLLRTDYISPDELSLSCFNGLEISFGSKDNQIHSKAKKVIRILEKLCSDGSTVASIIPALDRVASIVGEPVNTETTELESDMLVSNFSFIKVPFATPSSGKGDLLPS